MMNFNFGALAALLGPLFKGLGMPPLPPAFTLLKPTPPRKKRGKRYSYGAGLVQPQRMRNLKRMEKLHKLRDEHGAYTRTGRVPAEQGGGRRKWLAGISAQRGF
jgi:hypothetical protein